MYQKILISEGKNGTWSGRVVVDLDSEEPAIIGYVNDVEVNRFSKDKFFNTRANTADSRRVFYVSG